MAINSARVNQPLALVLFSRQFSMAVDAGVSLVRCLLILEENAPPPYDEAARLMRPKIEGGHTLSSVMAEMPMLFSTFYVKMVRVGEIGGVLDETLRYLAGQLEETWKLSRQSRQMNRVSWLFHPSNVLAAEDWADLNHSQHTFLLMLFCRSLGTMLAAGVPPKLSLETAADMLPASQGEAVRAVAQGDLSEDVGGRLAALGFLPSLVTQMMEVGETHGAFDQMMEKVALVYEHELQCRLM